MYMINTKRLIYCCRYYGTWKLIKVLCADNKCDKDIDCPATAINNMLEDIDHYFKNRDSTWKEVDDDGQYGWTVTS